MKSFSWNRPAGVRDQLRIGMGSQRLEPPIGLSGWRCADPREKTIVAFRSAKVRPILLPTK